MQLCGVSVYPPLEPHFEAMTEGREAMTHATGVLVKTCVSAQRQNRGTKEVREFSLPVRDSGSLNNPSDARLRRVLFKLFAGRFP